MPRGSKPGERRGGRQAGTPNKITADVKAMAAVHTPAAMIELGRLSIQAISEQARVAAIKELFDRAYGKATLPLSNPDGSALSLASPTNLSDTVAFMKALTQEERDVLRTVLEKRLAAASIGAAS